MTRPHTLAAAMTPAHTLAAAMMRAPALVAVLFAAIVVGACSRGGFRELEPRTFPFPVDSLRTTELDGARHHVIYSSRGPWAINVLEVRLDGCRVPVAVKGARGAIGRTKTSVLLGAKNDSVRVIGGVNADFFLFTPPGVPTGAHVERGRVVTPPNQHFTFAVDSAGRPRIVTFARATQDSLIVDDPRLAGLSLKPFHPMEAVGGRGRVVHDSAITDIVDTLGKAFATTRHPRTAVGIADGGRRLLLVVVDGRQAGYSVGVSLRELAGIMLALGARDALNLDGGGSSAMVVAGGETRDSLRIANRPSDPAGERPVANALAVVDRCAAVRR